MRCEAQGCDNVSPLDLQGKYRLKGVVGLESQVTLHPTSNMKIAKNNKTKKQKQN